MKAKNAYQFFWAVAIICGFLACINYVSEENTTLDINIHDTYFVIAHMHLYILFTLFYFCSGLIYKVSERLQLNRTLTTIHTWITVGGFVTYYILCAIISAMHDPKNIFDNSMELMNIGITTITLIVIIAQPLLIINILIGLIKAIRK